MSQGGPGEVGIYPGAATQDHGTTNERINAMTSYTARVEWMRHVTISETELDELLDALAGYSPAIAPEDSPEHGPWILSATITLEAGTLRQAIAAALQAVETATEHKALAVEVLPTHEFDRRVDQPLIPPLVGNAEIARMLGVSRQRAGQLVDVDGFPPAAVTTQAGPLRIKSQVEAWAHTWQRKSGRPGKANATRVEA